MLDTDLRFQDSPDHSGTVTVIPGQSRSFWDSPGHSGTVPVISGGESVPAGQTILDFAEARDDGVAVASAEPYTNHLHLVPDGSS